MMYINTLNLEAYSWLSKSHISTSEPHWLISTGIWGLQRTRAFWNNFPFKFRSIFYLIPPPPFVSSSLNFLQNGNPSELPRAMPAGSLRVCLGILLVFRAGMLQCRCKSRELRPGMWGSFLVWLPSICKSWQAATEPCRWPGREPDRFTMKICLAG